ncbi:Trp biosynthesis-associated membrane protein [Gryllotalpicola protaetiae]|uniref:Trp biosynthesis-associated membrane protein n=1 Tax=Gryllotalpicola protaetiae TaxID=2419771 RepID=UPI0013C4D79E|nr:Trp biosynthesis-associated membrane protein [Gryllotalpicola protaetiae]
MTGGRLKLLTILVVVIGAGLGLAGATQTWFTVTLTHAAGHPAPVVVTGSDASPALTALSLAALALALAFAIAGRVARIIVGVIGVILGATVIFASAGDPKTSLGVRNAVSTATGITGDSSVHALIATVAASAWPTLALIGGILIALGSLAALVTGGRWPGGSRRYNAVRFEEADGKASATSKRPEERPGDSAVDDWDELTRGDDPTAD